MEQKTHGGCLMFQRKFLPEIYAERCHHSIGHNDVKVPDTEINLECDELIEDWDDTVDFNSSSRQTKEPRKHYGTVTETEDYVYDYPPPNSPADGPEVERTSLPDFQNRYVSSLLQIWRDSSVQETEESSISPLCQTSTHETVYVEEEEEEDGDKSIDESEHESMSLPSDENTTDSCSQGSVSSDSPRSQSPDISQLDVQPSLSSYNQEQQYHSDEIPDFEVPLSPATPNSSRASSPEIIQALSPSVLRMSFDNLRSVSPRIVRSPSPIDSRSSSPRFLTSRSPSPLNHLSDLSDSLVFYDERYVVGRISPVQRYADHQVPDIDTEFYESVEHFSEFPSPRSHQRQRWLNSCTDQVVPEWIEE